MATLSKMRAKMEREAFGHLEARQQITQLTEQLNEMQLMVRMIHIVSKLYKPLCFPTIGGAVMHNVNVSFSCSLDIIQYCVNFYNKLFSNYHIIIQCVY